MRGCRLGASPRMNSSSAGLSGSIVKPPPPMAKIVAASVRATATGAAEVLGASSASSSPLVHAVARGPPRRDVTTRSRSVPDEVQRRAVLGGVARRTSRRRRARAGASSRRGSASTCTQFEYGQQADARRPERRRAVERASPPRSNQHSEPALTPHRIAPAQPALAQDLVQPVGAPHAEQARDVPAAHVDDVLLEEVLRRVAAPRGRGGTARRGWARTAPARRPGRTRTT